MELYNQLNGNLGRKIMYMRKVKGISLRGLATKAGVSKSSLSEIENGKVNPRVSTLQLIATGLDISLYKLFEDFK